MKINTDSHIFHWAVMIFLAFIWGSSFIMMKKGIESFTFYQVGAMRIFISFLALLPIMLIRIKRIKKENIKSFLIVGFIGSYLPAILFTKAETEISSALAGMLNSLTPLFTLILGVLVYKTPATKRKLVGVLLGLVGALWLIGGKSLNFTGNENIFGLFVVVATLFYGISTNEIKINLKNIDSLTITSFSFMFIGPVAGVSLLFTDFNNAFHSEFFVSSFVNVILLALINTVLAMVVFNYLISKTSAVFSSTVTYIIPFFSTIWGVFYGEKLFLYQIMAMLVVFAGIYIISKKKLIATK